MSWPEKTSLGGSSPNTHQKDEKRYLTLDLARSKSIKQVVCVKTESVEKTPCEKYCGFYAELTRTGDRRARGAYRLDGRRRRGKTSIAEELNAQRIQIEVGGPPSLFAYLKKVR